MTEKEITTGMSINLDLKSQVEFNRRKNVQQDQRLSTLSSQVSQLIEQAPAGFLPRVYYGLNRGALKYRFPVDYEISEVVNGNVGDSFELLSTVESDDYINAIAVKINDTTLRITIQGDYNLITNTFKIVNMVSGVFETITLSENPLSLQEASYLGDYAPASNKEKQVTVLKDIELNQNNVVFASLDLNSDGIYNWVRIGNYINGKDGNMIFAVTGSTISNIINMVKIDDYLLAGTAFTYGNINFNIGDIYRVTSLTPLSGVANGNIRGLQGAQGTPGTPGTDGVDGQTPTIIDTYWYIGGVSTGVVARGINGQDGRDGQSFAMQSGLYSTPSNYGLQNNVGPNGEVLQELPSLPQSNISGKGYICYDPLTTPLEPYYDLYYANNGDVAWTIIHPFNGQDGRDGVDGQTPYILNNSWYIGDYNTGVPATGPVGPTGETGPTGATGAQGLEGQGINPMGEWVEGNEYYAYEQGVSQTSDVVTYNGSAYICILSIDGGITPPNEDTTHWQLLVSKGDQGLPGPQGPQGPQGSVNLYSSTGQNTDGAMTQKATTDAIGVVSNAVSTKANQSELTTLSGQVNTNTAGITNLNTTKANTDASNLSTNNVESWKEKLGIVNNTYDTAEHLTGKYWIDGKPIYRQIIQKTFNFSAIGQYWTNLNTNANIDTIVDMRYVLINNTVRQSFNSALTAIGFDFASSQIGIYCNVAWSSIPMTIFIEYTKR